MEDLSGTSLGTYRLLSVVGRGAQATVYRARQESVERDVAVKVLNADHARGPEFKQRFVREARAAASLEHPNVLPIYDYGEENGRCFIVMRLAASSLAERLSQAPPLTLEESVAIVGELAAALDCAHARKIVHRDVKPANVLLDARGRCLLADFGIAKLLDDSNLRTQTNLAVGTPNYMSPEQCSGLPIDGRADVYALAVLAYELVVGCRPFHADTPHAIAMMHLAEPVSFPAEATHVSAAVRAALLRGLDKNREDRCASAGEFASTLAQAARASQTDVTRALEALKVASKPEGRRRRAGWLGGVGLVVVGVGYAASWIVGDGQPRLRAQAEGDARSEGKADRPHAPPWMRFPVTLLLDESVHQAHSALGLHESLSGDVVAAVQRAAERLECIEGAVRFDPAANRQQQGRSSHSPESIELSDHAWVSIGVAFDLRRAESADQARIVSGNERLYAVELRARLIVGGDERELCRRRYIQSPDLPASLAEAVAPTVAAHAEEFARDLVAGLERELRSVLSLGFQRTFVIVSPSGADLDLRSLFDGLSGFVGAERVSDSAVRPQPEHIDLTPFDGPGAASLSVDASASVAVWNVRFKAPSVATLEAFTALVGAALRTTSGQRSVTEVQLRRGPRTHVLLAQQNSRD